MKDGAATANMYLLYTLIALLLILPELPHLVSYLGALSSGTTSLFSAQALLCILVVVAPVPVAGGRVWVGLRWAWRLLGAVARSTARIYGLCFDGAGAKKPVDSGLRIIPTPIPIYRPPPPVQQKPRSSAAGAGVMARGAQGARIPTPLTSSSFQPHHRPTTTTTYRPAPSHPPPPPTTAQQRSEPRRPPSFAPAPTPVPIPAYYPYTAAPNTPQRIHVAADFYSTTHVYAAMSQRLLLTQYTHQPAHQRRGGQCRAGAGCVFGGYGRCTYHPHIHIPAEKEKGKARVLSPQRGGARVEKGRRTSPVPKEKQRVEADTPAAVGGGEALRVEDAPVDGDLMELDTPPPSATSKEGENMWESAWRAMKAATRGRLRPQKTPAAKKAVAVQKAKGSGLLAVAGSGRPQARACVEGWVVKPKSAVKPGVKRAGVKVVKRAMRRGGVMEVDVDMDLEEEVEMEKENMRPQVAAIPLPATVPAPAPPRPPPQAQTQALALAPAPAPAPAPAHVPAPAPMAMLPPPRPPPTHHQSQPAPPPPAPTTTKRSLTPPPAAEAAEDDAGYDSFDEEWNASVAAERASLAAAKPQKAPTLHSLLNPAPVAPMTLHAAPSTTPHKKVARWLEPLPDPPVAKTPAVTMTRLPPVGPGGLAVRTTKVGPDAVKARLQARQRRLDRDDPDR